MLRRCSDNAPVKIRTNANRLKRFDRPTMKLMIAMMMITRNRNQMHNQTTIYIRTIMTTHVNKIMMTIQTQTKTNNDENLYMVEKIIKTQIDNGKGNIS